MKKIDYKKKLKHLYSASAKDPAVATGDKDSWKWTAMIYQHEIYLSDIGRAAPSKWKTIILQLMKG